jgi:rhodanese-related sulfurtransferase
MPTRSAPLAAALLLACSIPGGEPFRMASLDEVHALLGKPGVAVVDANARGLYEKYHLPGARHAGSAPLASLLPADRDATVVFYCSGPR